MDVIANFKSIYSLTFQIKMSVDQLEILKYMHQNNIGTELSMFYRAYSIIYTRQRNFREAHKWILAGIKKKAQSTQILENYLKKFDREMLFLD